MKEVKEKSILGIITEHAVNERLDAILFLDQKFLALQKEIDEQIRAFDSLDLSKEERDVVDRLVCAHTESEAYYSAAAYRLGFKDCAEMLSEIGVVRGQSQAALSKFITAGEGGKRQDGG